MGSPSASSARDKEIEQVFSNFCSSRNVLIKAHNEDDCGLVEFLRLCVSFTDDEVSLGLDIEELLLKNPQPTENWEPFAAKFAQTWLCCVADYKAHMLEFDEADRERLFAMIDELPKMSDEILTRKSTTVQHNKDSNDATSPCSVVTRSMGKRESGKKDKFSKALVMNELINKLKKMMMINCTGIVSRKSHRTA